MLRKASSTLFAGILVLTMAVGVIQAYSPGDLDQSFGTGGSTVVAITSRADVAYAVAIQADGKAVIAGYSDSGTDDDFAVVRFNLDGTLDTSFDGDGIVTTNFGPTSYDEAYAMAIQPDGKIIVAGSRWGQSDDVAVVRYNSDGSLDTSFDQDGMLTFPVAAGGGVAFAIHVWPNGKILLGGRAESANDDDILLAQLNPDGSLDTSFDGDGVMVMAVGAAFDEARSMAVQPDGKIILVGYSDNGNTNDVILLRFDPQGSLDTSFGNQGRVIQSFVAFNDEARDVKLMADGSIIVVGTSEASPSHRQMFVAKYQPNGILDSTFGVNGNVIISRPTATETANGVVVQADNKIVVVGSSLDNRTDVVAVRLMPDGSYDATFGDSGRVYATIRDVGDFANAVAVQPDGGIIVAGGSYDNTTTSDFVVARLHQQSAPTTTTTTTTTTPPSTTTAPAVAALTAAPTPLAYRAANKQVTLRWRAVEGAASYVVTTTAGAERCDTTATSCVIPRLRNGKAYTYLVYSVNADGVRSETAARVTARPGFAVKRTSLKAKRTLKLSSIVSTKSKGTKTWRVTSGGCRIQGARLVAPTKRGTCRLRLATAKRGSYPAMSTTIKLTITR